MLGLRFYFGVADKKQRHESLAACENLLGDVGWNKGRGGASVGDGLATWRGGSKNCKFRNLNFWSSAAWAGSSFATAWNNSSPRSFFVATRRVPHQTL